MPKNITDFSIMIFIRERRIDRNAGTFYTQIKLDIYVLM
jgi:hypothetical protein